MSSFDLSIVPVKEIRLKRMTFPFRDKVSFIEIPRKTSIIYKITMSYGCIHATNVIISLKRAFISRSSWFVSTIWIIWFYCVVFQSAATLMMVRFNTERICSLCCNLRVGPGEELLYGMQGWGLRTCLADHIHLHRALAHIQNFLFSWQHTSVHIHHNFQCRRHYTQWPGAV